MSRPDRNTQTFTSSDALETTPLRLFSPGAQLANRYVIRRAIDSGGSAVVYEAHDRELHRDIALKVLRPDRENDAALARFRREVAVARDASSPRLVRIFDIQTSDGAIYLTMELVEGESLRKRLLATPRLPIDEAVRIAIAIAEGLDALHSLNIIHRDIKPGNVLLDARGEVKLGDFGLARHLEHDTGHATSTGAIVGTLAYLSPEQALGAAVDARSDLYGLGVVLFEMLTGKLPFDAESAIGALLARMKTSPADVSKLRNDCPRWLAAIVARLLERKPEDRYASARAVLEDLRGRRAAWVPRRVVRLAVATAACITLVAAAGLAFRGWQQKHAFSHLIGAPDGTVNALSRSGEVLWTLRGYDAETALKYVVLERGHRGAREIAAVLRPPGDFDMERMHTLSFLDPRTGNVTRRVRLPDDATTNFRYLPRRYILGSLRAIDLDDDGHEEIIAAFTQYPEWPSYTVLYEPRIQRARGVFAATGHFHVAGAGDVDRDGATDLIFAGIHNGWGWYHSIAAVRLQPPANALDGHASTIHTPDMVENNDRANLLWLAYLPRTRTMEAGITARVDRDRIRVTFPSGEPVFLGLDGQPPEATNRAARAAARRRAFAALLDADRLSAAGTHAAAVTTGDAALRDAHVDGDPELIQTVQVRRGYYLVRTGRIDEAEAHYETISRDSASAADIAMEAAEEFHLVGELERAVRWYRRGLSFARAHGLGRSIHEFIEGLALALAELGRPEEGIAEMNRTINVYRDVGTPSFYREFLRWRAGQRPETRDVHAGSAIDVHRYWLLEFAYANGASPESLLPRIEPVDEGQAQCRSALLSLHADLLHRLGRTTEARAMIERALRLAEMDKTANTIARGHLALVRERHARIMETR